MDNGDCRRTFWNIIGSDLDVTARLPNCWNGFDPLNNLLFLLHCVRHLIVTLLHCCVFTHAGTTNSSDGGCSFRLCGRLSSSMSFNILDSGLHDHCCHALLCQCHIFDLLNAHWSREFRVRVSCREFDRLNDCVVVPVDFSECNFNPMSTIFSGAKNHILRSASWSSFRFLSCSSLNFAHFAC